MTRLRAAIVGLGQVGSRFDEEPRPSIWSHAGAFLALDQVYHLVGGADPIEDQRNRFQQRCPDAFVSTDPIALVRETRPDVLSICSPAKGRGALVLDILAAHEPRTLICEKPLEVSREMRRAIVDACADKGIHLIVNYTRRFEHVYRAVKAAISQQKIGRLVSITVRAPNRLWTIGCHALDSIGFFAGAEPRSVHVIPRPSLAESSEPAADAIIAFPSDVVAHLVTVGLRENLLFEIDLIGAEGRIQIVDNGQRALSATFGSSPRFLGYKVLDDSKLLAERPASFSPFVELAREAAALTTSTSTSTPPISSSPGAAALATEELLDRIVNSNQESEK